MFSKLKDMFKGKPEEKPVEAEESDALSYFSTHKMLDVQAMAKLRENPFLVTPDQMQVVSAEGVAMDGATGVGGTAKQAFTLGQQRIPEQLFNWYLMQSFIGYQACALISQQWLIDRSCSMKGSDAVRNGYKVALDNGEEADAELIKYIEKRDRKFKVKHNLRQADKFKNVFGIRHVLFLYDGVDYEKPFNPDGIKPGSYRGMSQIDPYWVTQLLTTAGVEDPEDPMFYEPEFWVISGKKIHHTHFAILYGPEVSDILKPSYQYGGIPLTQRIMERVYAAERTANEAPQLAMTKRMNVRKMDLEKAVANQAKFEDSLNVMARYRDNYGIYAIGQEEDYQQLETALTDLDVTIMTQYQIVAGITGIPATKLMGTSPKGFAATGDYEMDAYHEELESIQENDLSPIVQRHHLCLLHSELIPKFGLSDKDEIDHVWNPLSVMSEDELATMQMNKSTTAKNYIDIGALDAYDVRDAIAKDENSGFTGIETIGRPEDPDMDSDSVDVEEEKGDNASQADNQA